MGRWCNEESFSDYTVPWSPLAEGDEQPYWPRQCELLSPQR